MDKDKWIKTNVKRQIYKGKCIKTKLRTRHGRRWVRKGGQPQTQKCVKWGDLKCYFAQVYTLISTSNPNVHVKIIRQCMPC